MVQKFTFEKTSMEGVIIVNPFISWDERGCFVKDYSKEIFEENGVSHDLKEVFYTYSHRGVIRALHFQREKIQPKLVRCVRGRIYDVVVDLRQTSPTFGKWEGIYLSEENSKEILIPGNCAHGYLVLEASIVSYKCAEKFYGEFDDGIIWNDREINIQWPLSELEGSDIILSEKDKKLNTFRRFRELYSGL